MNRFTSAMLVAALAAAGASAFAQSTTVKPGQEQIQAQDPSTGTLDNNAQRQHSREQSSGANKNDGAGSTAAGATTSMSGKQAAPQGGATRDWASIDANRDNLIGPDEMEAALKQGGTAPAKPAAKK